MIKDIAYSKTIKSKNLPKQEIVFFPNSLYLVKSKTLIIGDLHLGFESSLTKEGIYVPNANITLVLKELKAIGNIIKRNKVSVKEFVIIGDIKHSFVELDKITKSEIELFFKEIDSYIRPKHKILIKGNHDTFLTYTLRKLGVDVKDELELGKILITHGHKSIETERAKVYIIGHEHPSVGIRSGSTFEQYKCFIFGTFYDKSNLIIMPSFTNVSVGSNIFKGQFLSPILIDLQKQNKDFIYNWDVLVYEQNHFFLFKVKELKEL